MSKNYTYLRKYIILKNDYTNILGLKPKGHAKIEIRGMRGILNINGENCQENEDYRVYLLKDQQGQIKEHHIGRIITDERGRTRTSIDLNLRDLESKGFSIGQIDAILIRKGIYILLAGYIDRDKGTIDRYIKNLVQEEERGDSNIAQDKDEETESRQRELKMEDELVEESSTIEGSFEQTLESEIIDRTDEIIEGTEKIDEVQELQEIQQIHEIEEIDKTKEAGGVDEEEKEEIEEIEEEIMEMEEIKEDFGPYEEMTSPEEIAYEEEKALPLGDNQYEENSIQRERENYRSLEYIRRLNHKNQMTNYILSILRFFPYVQPLKQNLHGYSWWRIDDDGTDSYKGFLPYFNYLMSTNYKYPFLNNATTCFNLIRKYGHYLFGMYKEERETKYYMYGVPGRFVTEEHPFKGITGFSTWYESINGLGYWILYIDPMTGKIIHPLNPMIPAY